MAEIHGQADAGFEKVRDAFATNFDQHGDVGAAFSLYVRGEKVVDLWAGIADVTTGRPWEEDTLQLVFSTTKGISAICAHMLAQQGKLDLDAPVAQYWPEFAARGKKDIPVRWLLSHRAGLPVIDETVTPEDVYSWTGVVDKLAAQAPVWEPGTAHGYHALTFGWLVGEVVRRVTGASIGTFVADEVAGPLHADLFIGLPASERARVSRLIELEGGIGGNLDETTIAALPEGVQAIVRAFSDPNGLSQRALMVTQPPLSFNAPEVHAAEIPAANGITTARALAKVYAAAVGEVDGVRLLDKSTIDDLTREQSNGPDRVLMMPTRFGSGFFLTSPFAPLLGESSFGHAGAGGSLGFADPDAEVGFGYVMNKMQSNLAGDPRTLTLIEAVRASL
jgi:CubicO group peptidase (beta-lactamase class C family)